MRCIQLVKHGIPGQFELRDVPDPEPVDDEVVVRVEACGLNHLDLWFEQGELPIPLSLPRIPGCEIAGKIAAVGPDAPDVWKPGDAVAVQSNLFCNRCRYCRGGKESMCLAPVMLGVQRDGGFAEKVVVPSRALVRLPAKVDAKISAALSLAGSTAMRMLTERVTVGSGDWVLVIGASSGVGSAAIQIARVSGANVIATASSEPKKALALELGAKHVVNTSDPGWPAEVRKLTDKRGVDVVVEHVGGETLLKCFECLARGGTIVTCGATAGKEVSLNVWSLFVKQQRLVGSYSRDRLDLEATLQWAADGRLQPVIHDVMPLAKAPEAYARLRSRTVLGKLLIAP
jgi:NADPH:quinone reductase-like Zn-dependent oxidoreductase